ncbi:MAG TPA: AsmA family protein, partial [Burkholderiales bacterium]|nr:AsmA family protein [Burkholderiales bacterium]
ASLNAPLYVRGTFSQPRFSLDPEAAAKGIGAIVIGVLNPLLAVIPLINEGPGKDSPCGELVASALANTKAAAAGRSSAAGATGSASQPELRPSSRPKPEAKPQFQPPEQP